MAGRNSCLFLQSKIIVVAAHIDTVILPETCNPDFRAGPILRQIFQARAPSPILRMPWGPEGGCRPSRVFAYFPGGGPYPLINSFPDSIIKKYGRHCHKEDLKAWRGYIITEKEKRG